VNPRFRPQNTKIISRVRLFSQAHIGDLTIISILCAAAGIAVFLTARSIDPGMYDLGRRNFWFDADVSRVFQNMTDRLSYHYRSEVHPIFSLLTFVPVFFIRMTVAADPLVAAQLFLGILAAIWMGTLFILLRILGCRKPDATVFALLAASSSAAVFWFVIPETYVCGSLSILLSLVIAALSERRPVRERWHIMASALTLSFTVTNWIAGITSTFVSNKWRRSFQITANALCLVVVLWTVQKYIFPTTGFFLGHTEEQVYALRTLEARLEALESMLLSTVVMPAIRISEGAFEDTMSVQYLYSPFGSLPGSIAACVWSALLVLGIWNLLVMREHVRVRIVLWVSLLGQVALHMQYGRETFLAAMHFLPVLVMVAALSTRTRLRPVVLVLAGLLVLTAAVNNFDQFNLAMEFVQKYQSAAAP